jgi:hypothetical protein
MEDSEPLRPATDEEVASTLAYALRFDARGRPWPAGMEIAAGVAGEVLAEDVTRLGLVAMKRRGGNRRGRVR